MSTLHQKLLLFPAVLGLAAGCGGGSAPPPSQEPASAGQPLATCEAVSQVVDLQPGSYGETFTGELAGVQSAGLNTLGVGATWYLMPGNLYLTGALSMADIAIALDSQQGGSNVGVGLHLGLGKEWWVSDNWALGVGAELALSRLPGRSGSSSAWGVASLSSLFSMTYN